MKELNRDNFMQYVKTALITGINGQDGSYLCEFLKDKNYKVYGLERRVGLLNQEDRRRTDSEVEYIDGDVRDYAQIVNIVSKIKPDEVYHLAAQSYVKTSFDNPFETIETNVNGTLNMLEAIKNFSPKSKFYFAASSEIFGNSPAPQNEESPMMPRSPYGVSKLAGFHLTKNYREAHDLFACSGILFNHESPRRGSEFVTKKIIDGVKDIISGKKEKVKLGNIETKRDWGYAKDYVEVMWKMLQQEKPKDYVIGTGETHSVEDFFKTACKVNNITDWKKFIEIDGKQIRPSEVNELRADYSKAKKELGFEPKTKFDDLVKIMNG